MGSSAPAQPPAMLVKRCGQSWEDKTLKVPFPLMREPGTRGIDAQQCPCCGAGRLRVVQTLAGPRQLPTASSTVLPQGRAPP